MSEVIQAGQYIMDYYNGFERILEELEKAENAAARLRELSDSDMYRGNGLSDLQQFTASLESDVYKLAEFYMAACSYLIHVLEEVYEMDAMSAKVIENISGSAFTTRIAAKR